jgi:hypothetical protein
MMMIVIVMMTLNRILPGYQYEEGMKTIYFLKNMKE